MPLRFQPFCACLSWRHHVHTHPQRQPLQDVVTAIRLKTNVQELGYQGFCNAERTLRPINTLQQLYPEEMLRQTTVIAAQCEFNMDELRYQYPEDLVPPHLTPSAYLRQLTYDGAQERWPHGIPEDTVTLIEKELELIAQLRYEHYFLTVQDIVQFARSQRILCRVAVLRQIPPCATACSLPKLIPRACICYSSALYPWSVKNPRYRRRL